MRFAFIIIFLISFFSFGALAGHNCKCQDSRGQYDQLTVICCGKDPKANPGIVYYGGGNHQCTSPFGAIDSGAFVKCCQNEGVGGAFCWD